MISITTVIQHIYKYKCGRTLLFQIRTGLLTSASVYGDTRRETQFLKVFANHTMQTQSQRAVHIVMFKISVCRDLQHSTSNLNGRKPNSLFQWSDTQQHLSTVNIQLTSFEHPRILRPISSGHDVIHIPAPFW